MIIYGYDHTENKCAKQQVIAVLIAKDGEIFIGRNECDDPHEECPRKGLKSGEGYQLCRDVCKQKSHAEVSALNNAGEKSKGSKVIVFGHTYCCDDCTAMMLSAGVEEVVLI